MLGCLFTYTRKRLEEHAKTHGILQTIGYLGGRDGNTFLNF